MIRLLEKIHAKPEAYRQNLALGITVILSSVIFLLWAISLPGRLSAVKDTVNGSDTTASVGTPLENLSDDLGTSFGAVKEKTSGLLKVISK